MKIFYCNGKKDFCEENEKCSESCKYYDGTGGEYEEDKISNYDRIKSMSVEEMAEMLVEEKEYGVAHETYFMCPDGMEFDEDKYDMAIEYTKQWLLQKEERENNVSNNTRDK